MKRKLQSIAMELSDSDIREIIRIRKSGNKKADALRKKRAKLAAELAQLDANLAKMSGGEEIAAPVKGDRKPTATRKTKKGAKKKPAVRQAKPASSKKSAPAKKAASTKKAAPVKKTAATKKKVGSKKGRAPRSGLSLAVRTIFAEANGPLKAKQVVDALPAAGIQIGDVAVMRKRISVILASQNKHFTQVGRGLYQLNG